jgi:hypothetical protein
MYCLHNIGLRDAANLVAAQAFTEYNKREVETVDISFTYNGSTINIVEENVSVFTPSNGIYKNAKVIKATDLELIYSSLYNTSCVVTSCFYKGKNYIGKQNHLSTILL